MSSKLEFIPTRASLLGRLKDWGDQSSWQEFFDAYSRLIYNVAVKSGLSDAEAQEVVQELRRNIQAELTALEPEIEALKTRAGKAEAEATKLINELKAHRKVLKEKLSELRHASGGAWEDVKTGATRAWDELRPALQSAISKFR